MLLSNLLPLVAVFATADAQYKSRNPKRGMISDFDSRTTVQDAARFTQKNANSVAWYYSFGQYQNNQMTNKGYQFIMQQFGVNETPEPDGNNYKNIRELMNQVDQVKPGALLTFLEPVIYGVSVDQAVNAWRKYIIPIKRKYPKMLIGSPSVINGVDSLPWIRSFIQKCPECKFDFLDVHYYWVWSEFQNELNKWHAEFPRVPIWATDIGFQDYNSDGSFTDMCGPQDKQCGPKIKEMITWMDRTPWIKRYTYRGEFRRGDPNVRWGWAFLNPKGNYTPLGAWYMGINQ